MKEQRSISVPGINLEVDLNQDEDEEESKTQPRPGSLFEVFMALKEKERYTIRKINESTSTKQKINFLGRSLLIKI